ncbi:MAG TPA: hypothetical protein VK427_22915, partial [Kofleriaceae bacterium]|nr:hypothetical protein [Kofleriaceae bacterium]
MIAPATTRVASDSGLSGLGLIMQLVGGIMTAFIGVYGMFMVLAFLMAGSGSGMPGMLLLFVVAIVGTSLARSIMHTTAGRRLIYDGPRTPLSALKRYFTISMVHTGVVAIGLLANNVPAKIAAASVLLLAAWPIALMLVARPKIAAFGDVVPMADDKGFDGAAILLLIFGSIGAGIGIILVLGWLEAPGHIKSSLFGICLLASSVMLAIRSVLQLRAGIRGTKAKHMAETAEAAEKYAGFGILASFVAGGALFVATISLSSGRGAGGAIFAGLLMIAMFTWVLMVWPLIVRKFFGDRQFATLMDERGSGAQDSSDRGLPTLGWLLLAFGTFALAQGLMAVLMGGMVDDDGAMGRGDNPMTKMMAMLGTGDAKSPWVAVAVAALQIWAGVELIRMTPRYKLAGMIFGVVATGVALWVYLPLFGNMMSSGASVATNPLAGVGFAMVAMSLVVPIAT